MSEPSHAHSEGNDSLIMTEAEVDCSERIANWVAETTSSDDPHEMAHALPELLKVPLVDAESGPCVSGNTRDEKDCHPEPDENSGSMTV